MGGGGGGGRTDSLFQGYIYLCVAGVVCIYVVVRGIAAGDACIVLGDWRNH